MSKDQIKGRAWLKFVICHLSFVILTAGCAAPAASSDSGPNPTEFIATRVVEVLTQNALTDNAPSPIPATPGSSPAPALSVSPAATRAAGQTPAPHLAATQSNATSCAAAGCTHSAEHFWLERPIPADYVYFVERTYPYGSTQGGQRVPHHGVEFENRSGTPVVAAAPGRVIVAGDDALTAYGPSASFYGNLVIVQLDQRYNDQPVYNLYGHLQTVAVAAGQQVETGEVLGTVGFTGVAIGPHLHFEVRVGRNDYESTRNPELWLKPIEADGRPWGAIAGRVVDTSGRLVPGLTVVIRPENVVADVIRSHYPTTYADESLNGDDLLRENFAISDLPPGTYTVSVNTTRTYRQTVTVQSGRIAWAEFVVNPPFPSATPTATLEATPEPAVTETPAAQP